MGDDAYERRLRAIVQNCLTDFEETMTKDGMHQDIVNDKVKLDRGKPQVYRSEYVE